MKDPKVLAEELGSRWKVTSPWVLAAWDREEACPDKRIAQAWPGRFVTREIHAAEEVDGSGHCGGGPRDLCQGLTERINFMARPHLGQSGEESVAAAEGLRSGAPKSTLLPECSRTCRRLVLAMG